ncbi:MAG: YhcH/YjgK/YiaL family protein [Spirochaetota bacterium]
MILASLDDIGLRVSDERLSAAFRFLRTVSDTTPDGEVEIDGRNVYAKVLSFRTQPREERFYETHRSYIDVQSVLSGSHIIEWMPRSMLAPAVYDDAGDMIKYSEHTVGTPVRMAGRIVAVLYPEDAHRPLCMDVRPGPVRVCVVKVKLPLW